ncbi:1-acyl-sn-glycerol-3-phosphate acyltransferase alpha [Leptinotarsa decemlineata]|uniref:1-acyl-sn-glycerol-3-phosphate acyltransferase alpha n=1 Tax=Leptinotarsa decemlineata TaxID=7539 RepID=UPI003D3066E9
MSLWQYACILLPTGTILWKTNAAAKCWMKFSVFTLCCVSSCMMIPLWLVRPKNSKNALLPSMGFRAACKILGLKYTIEGKENIVRESGSVVLINHQSVLDLIVLSHLWPVLPKCTVISKKEMMYYQPFGLAFWLCGAIFIDRSKSSEAQSVINKTGEIIRKRKARVLMFPEGTRNTGKRLLPFKKGAFHLAVASQCPIQPIAVSRYTFLAPNKFEDGEIKIRILPAIPTKGCSVEDIPRLIDEAYKAMSENVEHLESLVTDKVERRSKL